MLYHCGPTQVHFCPRRLHPDPYNAKVTVSMSLTAWTDCTVCEHTAYQGLWRWGAQSMTVGGCGRMHIDSSRGLGRGSLRMLIANQISSQAQNT